MTKLQKARNFSLQNPVDWACMQTYWWLRIVRRMKPATALQVTRSIILDGRPANG